MRRDLRLDTIRGLLLVLITINHLSGHLPAAWWRQSLTWQPLGYVSAAEGFVFVSGFTFALVSTRYAATPAALWRTACARARLIYGYHVGMILGLAALFWLVPSYRLTWAGWLAPYPETPLTTTAAMVLLLHQPPGLDILPMYTLFVLLSPVALAFLHRGKGGWLLTVSGGLWLLGQSFRPLALATDFLFPHHSPGHFNVLAWQFLYVLGLVLGTEQYRTILWRLLHQYLPWRLLLVLCGLALFLSRHTLFLPDITTGLDRTDLQWLRLANCLCLIAVISSVLPRLSPRAGIPWLAFLGQHSLQVFAFHVVALYLLLPVMRVIAERYGSTGGEILTALAVASLWIPAVLHKRYQERAVSVLPPKPEYVAAS